MRERMKAGLAGAHKEFFESIEVDGNTGIVKGPYVKFAADPHIGSRYGEMRKVMIVGMAIGYNPEQDAIQSFAERRAGVEDVPLNNHQPRLWQARPAATTRIPATAINRDIQ